MSQMQLERTVLVVDDDPDLLMLCRLNLEAADYQVIEAPDGRTALELARREKPDLVVLDVMMPGLDGWEVLASLRADSETAELPVVLLTGRSHERDQLRGWQAGASGYVIKPFDPEDLLDAVETALAAGTREERQQTRLRMIESLRGRSASAASSRLDGLISELLDLSQLERGELRLDPRPHPLDRLVERALLRLSSTLERHRVEVELEHGLSALVDENAISRALENLLSNAARFSAEGTRIRLAASASAPEEAIISVQDEGIGIPTDEHDRIFERFYRLPQGEGDQPGSGIGLAIVKEFVEAQHGRVWVESSPGAGSTFSLAVPRAPS